MYYKWICGKSEGMVKKLEERELVEQVSLQVILGTSVTWTQKVHISTVKLFPVSDNALVGVSSTESSYIPCCYAKSKSEKHHKLEQNETFTDFF